MEYRVSGVQDECTGQVEYRTSGVQDKFEYRTSGVQDEWSTGQV